MIAPGPIVTLVITTGATRGLRPALATVVGTTLGNALLLTAIAFGLSLGAGQCADPVRGHGLGGRGVPRLSRRPGLARGGEVAEGRPVGGHVYFARGLAVALTNPKTIVFFTGFLPQFIDPALPAGSQLVVMCAVSTLMAGSTDTAWAIASGMGRAWFMKPARAKLLGRLSGSVLIGGGVWLSWARRPT